MEVALRRAIERGELEAHFQPKVSFSSKKIVGSEALLRWTRPDVGLIPPNIFIPVAEESDLIIDLSVWMFRQACAAACEWNSEIDTVHKVSINVSSKLFKFYGNDFPRIVMRILEETNCSPEWIEIEITESLLLDYEPSTISALEELRSAGLTIAIDDFGTGYSALGYLARLPIDTVKIDRSFIQKITSDNRHAELVRAMLSIARCLDQNVVAEGVEKIEEAIFLEKNGCDMAQGYLYSKPVPKIDMKLMIAASFHDLY